MLRLQEQKVNFSHVSNQNFIQHHVYRGKTLRQLVDHQIAHKQRMTNQDIGTWIQHQHQGLQWIYAKKLEPIFKDMQKAKLLS